MEPAVSGAGLVPAAPERTAGASTSEAASSRAVGPLPLAQLQRSIGNRAVARIVQRTGEVVTGAPITVTGAPRGGVDQMSGLDPLRGQGDADDPNAVTMAHDESVVTRNSADPATTLPFAAEGDGWDGATIMRRLGQYDRMAGTDSDAVRCVQAVALASRIPDGPRAVISFLQGEVLDVLLGRDATPRVSAAVRVLRAVISRIEARTATYGDLSYAQEALHDAFIDDLHGTDPDRVLSTVEGFLETSRNVTPINRWVSSPGDVMSEARTLPPGGQLILTAWNVFFNSRWLDVEDTGVSTAGRTRMRVEINGRMRTIRRIDSSHRPDPSQIDEFSDNRGGHQLLLLKDNTTEGRLRLYEPEVTDTGEHLIDLDATGSGLATYFREDPSLENYRYVQIMGRIEASPSSSSSPFGSAAP